MTDLANEFFSFASDDDTKEEPIPGLAEFLAANNIAQSATSTQTVADKRPTVREIAVKVIDRIPSKPARPARSPLFWILAITTTAAFPPAVLVWLWLLRTPPTNTH